MMKLKGSLKLDKVYDVDGTDMYGVLLQDHGLKEVVDEMNVLMDYIRELSGRVEELENKGTLILDKDGNDHWIKLTNSNII